MLRPAAASLLALGALALLSAANAAPIHVLVTNDDGVRAAGIDAISRALQAEPDVRITVVAPQANRSGTGGSTTSGKLSGYAAHTRSGIPATAVRGTPADSVRYALDTVLPADRPDVVVSGINDGANLGPIRQFSGTVGAARAAARRGLPALAASQGDGHPPRFEDGVAATLRWFRTNRDALRPGVVDNLNIPSCRYGVAVTETKTVPVTNLFDPDLLGASTGQVVCKRLAREPRDDVRAFLQGYAALSTINTYALAPAAI